MKGPHGFDRYAVSGVALAAMALLLAVFDAKAALRGWLAAVTFASALPFGALCLSMMLRVIPGPWRAELSASSDAATLLMPLLLFFALPILAGLPWIYSWPSEHLDGFKGAYLTPTFFILRSLVILSGACLLSVGLIASRRLALAIGGLIAFVILHGLLATDWLLSLDPEMHSSGFGLYVLAMQMLSALCLLIVIRLATVKVEQPDLLGGLLLTALLLWIYLAFMQYFITWSDNLPAGVVWYQRRASGIWKGAEYLVTALHLLPTFLLVFPPVRSHPGWLAGLGLTVLVATLVECAWLTLPGAPGPLVLSIVAYLLSLGGFALCCVAILRRADRYIASVRNVRIRKADSA